MFINVVHAQRFVAGISGGLSTSQVDGDGYGGFNKAGITVGGFVNTHLSEKVIGQFEINYINKGSKKVPDHEKGDYSYYLLKLNYIEIPILLKFEFHKFTYEVGLSYGKLLRGEEFDESGTFVTVGPFNPSEFALNVGLNYTLYKQLSLDCRYSRSILPIRDKAVVTPRWGINGGSYNSVICFILKYQFTTFSE